MPTARQLPSQNADAAAGPAEWALLYQVLELLPKESERTLAEWMLMYGAFALLRKETERALAPWPMTVAQAYVLALLDAVGRPLPVTRVAKAMLQESPSVTRLVDRMCSRGLVRRLPDPADRRRSLVAPTDRGRELLRQTRRAAAATSNEAFGALSPRERTTLKRLLRKFTDAARDRLDST
jgi:DNA-binding MarR family transcriptional regulator